MRLALAEAAALLRSGATPEATWRAVGVREVAPDGAPLHWGNGWPAVGVRAAARLAHRSGAALAPMLDAVAHFVAAEDRAEAVRDAAMAGPQLSARVLSWLPAAGLVLGAVVEPGAVRVLVATPLGWVLACGGAALWWAGRAWMRRLLTGAVAATPEQRDAERPPPELLFALLEAAVGAGLDTVAALEAVAAALSPEAHRGVRGEAGALADVALALRGGSTWAGAWAGRGLDGLERALRWAWVAGSSPRFTLAAAADGARLSRRRDADRRAGELGVRLALPLALCLLPAFALVGLGPMLVAVVSRTGLVQ